MLKNFQLFLKFFSKNTIFFIGMVYPKIKFCESETDMCVCSLYWKKLKNDSSKKSLSSDYSQCCFAWNFTPPWIFHATYFVARATQRYSIPFSHTSEVIALRDQMTICIRVSLLFGMKGCVIKCWWFFRFLRLVS